MEQKNIEESNILDSIEPEKNDGYVITRKDLEDIVIKQDATKSKNFWQKFAKFVKGKTNDKKEITTDKSDFGEK